MKIKTKSGFTCDVNEDKVKDWRFCKSLAKCDSGDESAMLQGITFVVPFLLGSEGEEALLAHITDKNGLASTEKVIAEFKDIMGQIGEASKKLQSSQD